MEERYRGPLGGTRRERVHWACPCGVRHSVEVVVSIDSQADPLLARRLRDGDPAFNDTVCPETRVRSWVEVPVVYHDPVNRLFVLVLPGGARAREIEERAALLLRLARDTDHAVPDYVVRFAAVYGPEGLRGLLERQAERALEAERRARDSRELPAVAAPDATAVVAAPAGRTAEGPARESPEELADGGPTAPRAPGPVRQAEHAAITPPEDASPGEPAVGVGPAAPPPLPRRLDTDGRARIALRAAGDALEALCDPTVEVRLQLHRMANFPLISLAFGAPAALAGAEGAPPPVWVVLDIGAEQDRAILHALGRRFLLRVDLLDGGDGDRPAGSLELSPPLADNVLCALSAATDCLKAIPSDQRSFARGLAEFESDDYDRLGRSSSRAGELDDAVLEALATPAEVVRAAALVKRLSKPAGEDWLILTRGYAMERWQARRRAVVARAVELGIWPGPVGAQIAVGDGLARSRVELAVRLERNFAALLAAADAPGGPAHGLDDAAVRENWKALRAEARALGLPRNDWLPPRSHPIGSEIEPVASGTIDPFGGDSEDSGPLTAVRPPTARPRAAQPAGEGGPGDITADVAPAAGREALALELARAPEAELVAALGERERRLAAALELTRRGEESGIEPVFRALEGMSRAEAGRVLAGVQRFGRSAEPRLLAGLRSRKAFLRQGAALALALLRSEAGVEALCDLLLDEPTEIWREVARALGETGSMAVLPLAARVVQRPEAARERAAWALAHIAARGARRPIDAIASGRDPVAAGVARHARELVELAASDNLAVRAERAPRDQSLNRTFSRRFFEAVRAERRAAAEAAAARAREDGDGVESITATALLLDTGDLLEVDADGGPDPADAPEVARAARAAPDERDTSSEPEEPGESDVAPS